MPKYPLLFSSIVSPSFSKYPSNIRFSGQISIGVFCRIFQNRKKEQTEPETGFFYPWESSTPDRTPGIWYQTVSSVSFPYQGMTVSAQSIETCSLEIENFAGALQREIILQVFRGADVPNDLNCIKCRSGEKTQTWDPKIVLRITVSMA
jgi:hypothetical protein